FQLHLADIAGLPIAGFAELLTLLASPTLPVVPQRRISCLDLRGSSTDKTRDAARFVFIKRILYCSRR
ncbi:hypothetical protein KJ713_02855, partial [Patescibacteria group bacterium]|nr:hypothetical protein [Patescibacteria group bacterium]